jgi:WD40 repeat protein
VVVRTNSSTVSTVLWLADERLASGGEDGTIAIWHLPKALPKDFTPKPEKILTNGSSVRSLAVLPDGRLASGGGDGSIQIWHLPRDLPKEFTPKPEKVVASGSSVWSLAVWEGRLASGHEDGTIKIWGKDFADKPDDPPPERQPSPVAGGPGWAAG